MGKLSMRLAAFALLLLAPFAVQAAPVHGIALVGEPLLPKDFPNFPYVNPDAPKGGEVVTAAIGSFVTADVHLHRLQ